MAAGRAGTDTALVTWGIRSHEERVHTVVDEFDPSAWLGKVAGVLAGV